MSNTYALNPRSFGRRKAQYGRTERAEAVVPLITPALAITRAEDVSRRMRRQGSPESACSAAYMAELARVQRLIGRPVDVLFGEAAQ